MGVSQTLSITEVAGSANAEANTSMVRILWKSKQDGESWNGYTRTAKYYVSINGGAETEYSVSYTLPQNTTKTIVDRGIAVTHRADGSGTVRVRTWMDTGISAGIVEKTQTLTLATIPRASTITSASNRTLGSACGIKWTPLSTSFRYKLKFSLGDWSYTTGAINPNTTSAYTYTGYTIPLTVANQLPNSKTGTMTVTLTTYSDSTATTPIGASSSKTFTVTVPELGSTKPSVSMSIAPVSSLKSPFNALYIQGLSKVKATLSGEGKYDAEIASYKMYVGTKSYSSPYQSDYLTTSGKVTVKGRAYDTRGYYGEVSEEISVIPYSKPKLLPASGESAIVCARCDQDGNLTESGTYLKIKARRSYSTVTSDGVQENFCAIRYRCVAEGKKFSGDDGWITLLAGSTTSTNAINKTLSGVVSSAETAYVVQVGVIDDVGESDVVQFLIPTDFLTIDIPEEHKGRRIGLLRYARDTDEVGIDVGGPIFGGSVDSLKIGTSLTATEAAPIDLNDIKTPGCYYSPGADYSKYILNSPYTTGGFGLEVRELQSKNYIRQTLYFGRTTLIRHWNTTEWSDWLRYMATPEMESSTVDFVTEIGVWYIDDNDTDKGYWRYRKWKSGAVDMNGFIKVSPVTEGTLGTAGVYYSETINIDLPFEVSNFQFVGSGTAYHIFVGNTNSVDGNSKQVRLRLYRFTDFSGLVDYDVYIRIIASGKLK